MHGNPLAASNIANDVVARQGMTTGGQVGQQVTDTQNLNSRRSGLFWGRSFGYDRG